MSGRMPRRASACLDDKIFAAFRQACREGELDVAEHLMRALETLAESVDGGSPHASADSCLDRAYLVVAEEFQTGSPKACCRPKMPRN